MLSLIDFISHGTIGIILHAVKPERALLLPAGLSSSQEKIINGEYIIKKGDAKLYNTRKRIIDTRNGSVDLERGLELIYLEILSDYLVLDNEKNESLKIKKGFHALVIQKRKKI